MLPDLTCLFLEDFWTQVSSYFECPKVTFSSKYFVQTQFIDKSNQNQVSYEYSSVKPIRDSLSNKLAPPTISFLDSNVDSSGKTDQLTIKMRIKKPSKALTLSRFNILLAFNEDYSDQIKMKLEGVAIINVDCFTSGQLAASKVSTHGTLQLKQQSLIKYTGYYKNDYNDDYFDSLTSQSMDQFIQNYYTNRNETLVYRYQSNVDYGQQT